MAETREESQTKIIAEEDQTSIAKENQTGVNAKKKSCIYSEKPNQCNIYRWRNGHF